MGFQRLWGSLGQKVLRVVKGVLDPIREALHIGKVGGIEVEPTTIHKELSRIYREDASAPGIAGLGKDDYISASLHTESEIPWKHPYAYEVEMYGRDVATGRFTHTSRILTFSHELTIGEIEEEANARFGETGAYPQVSVFQMSVTGAYTRAGEIR